MRHAYIFLAAALIFISACIQGVVMRDKLTVDGVTITWLGHASFMIEGSKVVYVDPFVLQANATKADYIAITHEHFDHCAPDKVAMIQSAETRIITPHGCLEKLSGKTNSITVPGDYFAYGDGVRFDAVPAYNTNKSFHPKDFGIGYVITIDSVRIYHAGDTDNIPDMANLTGIDVALLPIGGTYTMNADEAAAAAKAIKPRIAVPMHFSSSRYGVSGIDADPQRFADLLKNSGIEVVILKPQA